MKHAEKLILIGLDGIQPYLLLRFAENGVMPNTARLLREGAFSLAYPSPPCDTPTNWATIVTGAWTGTHCMTSFFAHTPGADLDKGYPTLNSRACKAEFLWNVLEEKGKKCLIVNYPVAWPPTIKKGIVIGGPAPGASPWRVKWPVLFVKTDRQEPPRRLRKGGLVPLRFTEARGWSPKPHSFSPPLEAKIQPLRGTELAVKAPGWQIKRGDESIKIPTYYLLILDTQGKGYDTLIISRGKNLQEEAVATLKTEEWSNWIVEKVEAGNTVQKVIFRFKLVSLSPDAKVFKLYMTDIFLTEGWSSPSHVAKELVEKVGPYIEGYEGHVSQLLDWFGEKYYSPTWLEHAEQSAKWFADTATYLKDKYAWDVFIMHFHLHDFLNHKYLGLLYEAHPGYEESAAKEIWGFYRECYRLTDMLIGRIVKECSDGETLIVLVSDHGAVPAWKFVWLGGALIRNGLLAYKWDPDASLYVVDWSKTRAYPFGHTTPYIWVNLKGRDPHGIVDQGEYREVQEETIDALYSIRDPENGRRPVALALRKEEAEILGQWGEHVGDVVYFLEPGYTNVCFDFSKISREVVEGGEIRPLEKMGSWTALHHDYLPNAKLGLFTNSAFVLMSGPGVRRDYRRDRPIWLVDVTPTICWLMNIRTPRHNEGKLVIDFLESG